MKPNALSKPDVKVLGGVLWGALGIARYSHEIDRSRSILRIIHYFGLSEGTEHRRKLYPEEALREKLAKSK